MNPKFSCLSNHKPRLTFLNAIAKLLLLPSARPSETCKSYTLFFCKSFNTMQMFKATERSTCQNCMDSSRLISLIDVDKRLGVVYTELALLGRKYHARKN